MRARSTARRRRTPRASATARWPPTCPTSRCCCSTSELRFTLVEGEALQRHGWRREELEGRPGHRGAAGRPGAPRSSCRSTAAPLAGETTSLAMHGMRGGEYQVDIVPMRSRAGAVVGRHERAARRHRSRACSRRRQELLGALLAELAEQLIICDEDGPPAGLRPRGPHDHARSGHRGRRPARLARVLPRRRDRRPRAAAGRHAALPRAARRGRQGRRGHHRPRGRAARRVRERPPGLRRRRGAAGRGRQRRRRHRAAGHRGGAARQRGRHRSILDSIRDTVCQVDLQGRWTFLGGGFEAATGYAPLRSSAPCWDLVHPDDRIAHGRAFAPLLSGEVDFIRHRHRVVTASGAVRWAEARAQLERDAAGAPRGMTGVIEDVTDAQRAQQYGSAERAVLDVLAHADDADGALSSLLQVLCLHLEWDAAELWVPDATGDVLQAADGWPQLPARPCRRHPRDGRRAARPGVGAAPPGVAPRLRPGRARLRARAAGLPGRGADRGGRARLARPPRAGARAGPAAGDDRGAHRPVRRAGGAARPAALHGAHRPPDRAANHRAWDDEVAREIARSALVRRRVLPRPARPRPLRRLQRTPTAATPATGCWPPPGGSGGR